MRELKSEAINLRMTPGTKALLRQVAELENRTLSNMLEVLILQYCKDRGIQKEQTENKQRVR